MNAQPHHHPQGKAAAMASHEIPNSVIDELLVNSPNEGYFTPLTQQRTISQVKGMSQVESQLSMYSIDDPSQQGYSLNDTTHNHDFATPTSTTHSYSNNTLPSPSTMDSSSNSSSDHLSLMGAEQSSGSGLNQDIMNQIFLDNELNNGRIHGHIHNFENFTYIHGHIHTNDEQMLHDSTPELQNNGEFSECHHFEFLNCHDHSQSKDNIILEDNTLICQEDESCKPKIVEICCDNDHKPVLDGESSTIPTAPFVPNLPNCTELHCDDNIAQTSDPYHNIDTCFLVDVNHNHENDSECIDIKCDLNTSCDLDELCKVCDEIGEVATAGMKVESSKHSHMNHALETIGHRHHHHHKRGREEEHEPLHHHLHHSHSHHSINHHHHHIQVHDHGNKKSKLEGLNNEVDGANNLINFEWNFKNMESVCEWDSCLTTLDNSFQLQNHIFESHLINNQNNAENVNFEYSLKNTNVQSKCEWKNCDFESVDLFELVNHINSQHVNMNLPSPVSLKKFQKSHNDDIEVTTCEWQENGTKCHCKFETAGDLTDHIINEHIGQGKSQYICHWEGCSRHGKIFNQKQKIVRHLHVHTHYKPFKCPTCNHSFAVETMLEQHMRTHSGEKPFECKVCQKTFATSSSLSIHMRTHTGEKPLLCKYPGCGKRFSESSNLTKHMKTHEKEFKCSCCSKSFGKEKQLESHMAKYHK